MAKAAPKKPPSKTEVLANIAAAAGLTKKDVAAVLDALSAEIGKALGKRGAGVFTMPGLCKFMVKHKPATKARKGINRFTGLEVMIKAKPARNVVKIRPLKGLKDMV